MYRARDRTTGETVALKVIQGPSTRFGQRFAREARVLSGLSHPGIVRYVDHGALGDGYFLAMEWIEGHDPAVRLASQSLTVPEALVLGLRIAESLAVAHRRGVVHRDLKPMHIILPDGAREPLFRRARVPVRP